MHNDSGYKHMPEIIYATPKKTWSWYEVVVDCSGNPTKNRKAHPRYKYIRADLIKGDYLK